MDNLSTKDFQAMEEYLDRMNLLDMRMTAATSIAEQVLIIDEETELRREFNEKFGSLLQGAK